MKTRCVDTQGARCEAQRSEKTLAIYQPRESGHRYYYVRMCIENTSDLRCVLITSKEGLRSREFGEHLAELYAGGQFEVEIVGRNDSVRRPLRVARRYPGWRMLVLDADSRMVGWFLASLLHGKRLTLLVMRPPDWFDGQRRSLRGVVKSALISASAKLARVRLLASTSDDKNGDLRSRSRFVPDPYPQVSVNTDKSNARRRLGLQGDDLVLAILGVITARKNPVLAMEVVVRLRSSGRPATLLLVGTMGVGVQRDLEGVPGFRKEYLHVVDDYVNDELLQTSAIASDCVLLLHTNEGTSGVLRHARMCNVPVLAAGSDVLMSEVKATSAGLTCGMSPSEVVAGVLQTRSTIPMDAAEARASRASFVKSLTG